MITPEILIEILNGYWTNVEDSDLREITRLMINNGNDPTEYKGLEERIADAPHSLRIWNEDSGEDFEIESDVDNTSYSYYSMEMKDRPKENQYKWETKDIAGRLIEEGITIKAEQHTEPEEGV